MANLDDDEDFSEEGTTAHEVYAELLLKDEIIVTISIDEAQAFKQRLISIKGKENSKLKAKGIPVESTKLSMTELAPKEDTPLDCVRLYLHLTKRKTFNITKIESPSDF